MIDFIINHSAGKAHGKHTKKIVRLLEKRLIERKIPYVFHLPPTAEETKKITTKIIKQGAKIVVSVGGDGTLHQIINGFTNFESVSLGIIPCGTGNDFATAINIPTSPLDALDLILEGEPKFTDYMQMPSVRGINIIGMGIDVDVLNKYSQLKKKNKWGYTKCLIQTLMNFDYSDFDAQLNGQRNHYRSFIACVANGYQYGGGIKISPESDATDNLLDFVAVGEIKKSKILGKFLQLKKGKILTFPETTHIKTKNIKIFTDTHPVINVDGELYKNIPFEVKIVSNKLKVFRP